MELQIRMAEENDAPAIETLLSKSFAEFKSVYTKEAFDATAIKSNGILERMREGPLWVALHDGKIIGTVSAVIRNDSLYIRGMAVHPESRGKRVGEKLMEEFENYAGKQKIKRMYLGTTKYLKSAIKLYERMGFKEYDVENFYGMRLMMMEKYLNI